MQKNKKKPAAAAPPAAPKKAAVHYTEKYLVDPAHPVTVNLIGCGGTGSQVLSSLARMNSALRALNHPGLFVRAIDPDRVTTANMGRQLFSPSDVDSYKCVVLAGRINRFFGTDWEGVPEYYKNGCGISSANITISCVDTGAARRDIRKALGMDSLSAEEVEAQRRARYRYQEPYEKPYYWMDYGNMMDRGQVVLGTVGEISQPKGSQFLCREKLAAVDKLHPDILRDNKKDNQGPSCSLAEALQKQDLFINTNLANMGMAILWKMFRELRIKYHGCYLNLETLIVNPIKIN
jgi:PRTRC genetic system ThiF family protein